MEDLIIQGSDFCCTANYNAGSNLDFLSQSIELFSSFNDIFSRLMNLTCYISRHFIHFIEDLVSRDVYGSFEDTSSEKNIKHSKKKKKLRRSNSKGCSTSLKSYNAGTSSEIHERRDAYFTPVNTRSDISEINHSYLHVSFFQGLMLPLFGLRLSWKLAFACWRCSFRCLRRAQVRVRRVIVRVQRTLHGSSDDIGWLQHTPGMAPVEDGTTRFVELLQGIRKALLLSTHNHGPLYFVNTKKFFSKMGLVCHIARIHSEASVEQNAWELKQYIEELYWGCGKQVMLLGHSKGGVDAAAALSIYCTDLKDKVAGLALVQSPYGGTPLASDILREGQIADVETRRIMEFLICKLIKGDMRALEDLTYDKRREFIMKHKLPEQIPLISFHSEASIAPSVLATMTHIAHAELPWLPLPRFGKEEEYDTSLQAGLTIPVKIPVSAAMAISALHLQLRYGEKSDGLVTCRDAEVPGSVVIRPDRKLDHAWMVYSSWKKDLNEPDACEMCEAILTMLVELGKMKKFDNESDTSHTI